MSILIITLLVLIIGALILGLQGLVYWGIGYFVCWAFQIPFEFGFVHGLAVAVIISTIAGAFNRIRNDD